MHLSQDGWPWKDKRDRKQEWGMSVAKNKLFLSCINQRKASLHAVAHYKRRVVNMSILFVLPMRTGTPRAVEKHKRERLLSTTTKKNITKVTRDAAF